jgi:hypothetical protein
MFFKVHNFYIKEEIPTLPETSERNSSKLCEVFFVITKEFLKLKALKHNRCSTFREDI